MVNSQPVKGFRDFVGVDASKRVEMLRVIRKVFELYGFEPLETPIVESESFVKGDNENDEAVRDVFTLQDRGKRELALRYEFTFQLGRAAKNQRLPYKNYKIGYLFRDEPIRKGRLRQFIQCDADIVGSSVSDEAECLALTQEAFRKLGISSTIYVNNRKLLNEILESEGVSENVRAQSIREIDKLDKLSKKEVADNLKKLGTEKLLKVFDSDESYFEKYAYYSEVKALKQFAKEYGVKVVFKPTLARGLSYYNGSIFEVWSDELDVSLAGGGSYLVGEVQSTGISFGLEPLFLLSNIAPKGSAAMLISIDQDKEAIELSRRLRETGIRINMILNKTVKKALEYANSKGVSQVIILGKNESQQGKVLLKDMKSGEEKKVNEEMLIAELLAFQSS